MITYHKRGCGIAFKLVFLCTMMRMTVTMNSRWWLWWWCWCWCTKGTLPPSPPSVQPARVQGHDVAQSRQCKPPGNVINMMMLVMPMEVQRWPQWHGIAWYSMIPSCIETRLRVNIVATQSKKIKITFLEEIHICRNTETFFYSSLHSNRKMNLGCFKLNRHHIVECN